MAYYPVGSGKQISIFASELAAAIEQHPYQTREETACKVWKRFDRPSFAFSLSLAHAAEVFEICKKYFKGKSMRNVLPDEVESELGKQQFTNSLKEIFSDLQWRTLRLKVMNFVDTKELPEAQEQVLLNLLGESERVNQAVATLCSEEKKSVQEKVEEVCKTITKETGKTVDKPTQDALAHKLRRDRGTVLETKTVTEFAATSGKKVRREPAKLYKKVLTYNDISWLLVGRVDARDESTIVEVKNRTRRFMCPDYDCLQLQAYMYLCGKNKGILLERLHGKNQETEFEFNASYWNDVVVPGMYEFIHDIEERILMSRSILDGVTPPVSPRKRACMFQDESPPKLTKLYPLSPVILHGSSWDNEGCEGDSKVHEGDSKVHEGDSKVHEGDSKVHEGDSKVHEGDSKVHEGQNEVFQTEEEVCEEIFGENEEGSLWVNDILYGSSSDNEPSSDLGENTSQVTNDSFTLFLSPSDTESDEELANLSLDGF